jgi:hypothetical protein
VTGPGTDEMAGVLRRYDQRLRRVAFATSGRSGTGGDGATALTVSIRKFLAACSSSLLLKAPGNDRSSSDRLAGFLVFLVLYGQYSQRMIPPGQLLFPLLLEDVDSLNK